MLLLATVAGCKDSDPVDPNSDPTLFPMAAGTYWIYSSQTIDTTGALSGPVRTDSTVVLSTSQALGGRTASMVATFHISNGTGSDTSAYSSDAHALYAYLPLNEMLSEGRWIKIIDRNATGRWVAFDTTLALPLDSTGTITVGLKLTMEVENVGTQSIAVPAGTFNATEYRTTLTTSTSIVGFPITGTVVTHYYQVPELGFVQIRQDVGHSFNPLDGSVTKSQGNLQQLLRYSIL